MKSVGRIWRSWHRIDGGSVNSLRPYVSLRVPQELIEMHYKITPVVFSRVCVILVSDYRECLCVDEGKELNAVGRHCSGLFHQSNYIFFLFFLVWV